MGQLSERDRGVIKTGKVLVDNLKVGLVLGFDYGHQTRPTFVDVRIHIDVKK